MPLRACMARCCSVGVPEVELGQVAAKAALEDFLVRTDQATLEDREEVLIGVRLVVALEELIG